MTDLVITPANVSARRGATIEEGIAGATITAGKVVYKDDATKKYLLADCDHATAAVRKPRGIALHGASDGQPLAIITEGGLNAGATVEVGTIYVLSRTAGGIAPAADVADVDSPPLSPAYVSTLGIGVSASRIDVRIHSPGAAVPVA